MKRAESVERMKKDFNDGDAWFISCTGSGTMAASMEFSRLSALAESQDYKTLSALLQESLTGKSIIAWTSAPEHESRSS